MNKIINRDKVGIFLVILVVFFIIQGLFSPKNSQEVEYNTFIIEKGENVFGISQRLKEKELIGSSFLFNLHVFVGGNYTNLKAGQYSFSQNMNILEIAREIIQGKTVKEIITIPEGWNLRDIAWFFENEGLFQAEEVLELTGFPAINYSLVNDLPSLRDFQEYDFLQDKPQNISLEGYIFPDTYKLEIDFGIEDFIKKALDNFDKKIDSDLKQVIEEQDKTIFEIITMASLIEREARKWKTKKLFLEFYGKE